MNTLKNSLLLSLTVVLLSSCVKPLIEKGYDDFERRTTCRMAKHQVKGPVNLALEMQDNNTVSFLVSLNSYNYLTNMRQNPKVMFKLYKSEKLLEEITFQGTSKNWISEMLNTTNKKKSSLIPYSGNPDNQDYAAISIDKATFNKIASVDYAELIVQTNQDPVRVTLSSNDLDLFREFQKTCF